MTIELSLILGPMFAGKSSFLINKINALINDGLSLDKMLIINHASDIRYDTNKICSHNGDKINSISLTYLIDIINHILNTESTLMVSVDRNIDFRKLQYIFIDEGQFFNDLYQSIKKLLLTTQKDLQIFICGLDGDYKQEPFTNSRILDLIPYSNNIYKLNAKCYKCNNNAPFTKRITNTDTNTDNILVGGANEYQPACILHLTL